MRRMRSEDVPGIMKIESVSFGRHHWADDSFHNEMNNQLGRYYSLFDTRSGEPCADNLIGYCGYWLILDEAHVTTVAVDPIYRGNSLGELLLVHMLDRTMGQTVKWLTLEVRVSNYSAQNLYYKYGFRSVGVRPKYYQDNQENALIMTTPNILTSEYRALYNQKRERLIEKLGGTPAGFGM